MRSVYVVSGGVSKFTKARPDKTFQAIVKEAYDYALADVSLAHPRFLEIVDGTRKDELTVMRYSDMKVEDTPDVYFQKDYLPRLR